MTHFATTKDLFRRAPKKYVHSEGTNCPTWQVHATNCKVRCIMPIGYVHMYRGRDISSHQIPSFLAYSFYSNRSITVCNKQYCLGSLCCSCFGGDIDTRHTSVQKEKKSTRSKQSWQSSQWLWWTNKWCSRSAGKCCPTAYIARRWKY